MFVNDGVGCHAPSVGMKPWFYLEKSGFFAFKPKTQCISREKAGLFPPLGKTTNLCGSMFLRHLGDSGEAHLKEVGSSPGQGSSIQFE